MRAVLSWLIAPVCRSAEQSEREASISFHLPHRPSFPSTPHNSGHGLSTAASHIDQLATSSQRRQSTTGPPSPARPREGRAPARLPALELLSPPSTCSSDAHEWRDDGQLEFQGQDGSDFAGRGEGGRRSDSVRLPPPDCALTATQTDVKTNDSQAIELATLRRQVEIWKDAFFTISDERQLSVLLHCHWSGALADLSLGSKPGGRPSWISSNKNWMRSRAIWRWTTVEMLKQRRWSSRAQKLRARRGRTRTLSRFVLSSVCL